MFINRECDMFELYKDMLKKKTIRIIIGLLLLNFLGIIALYCYSFYLNQNTETYYSSEPSSNYLLSVQMNTDAGKHWLEDPEKAIWGAQYDGVFENNSRYTVEDWCITLQVPAGSSIDSCWEGDFSYDDATSTISITPHTDGHNNKIPAGSTLTFGMILHTLNSPCYIDSIQIAFHQDWVVLHSVPFFLIMMFIVMLLLVAITYIFSNIRYEMAQKRQQLFKQFTDQTLMVFSKIIDAKDPYTHGHSFRVAQYSLELAKRINLSSEAQEELYYIALLHDIGKVGIPDHILNKPGSLTPEERTIIQTHTNIGGDILKEYPALSQLDSGARYHHERYDGKGYPSGLAGSDIPLYARIICVADSYDAMSCDRCYRPRLTNEAIMKELLNCSGTQFDPDIATHMIQMIQDNFQPLPTYLS